MDLNLNRLAYRMKKAHWHRFARLAVLALGLLQAGPAVSQSTGYPNRALHFVVPFGAGGTSDQVARLLGTKLAERLGQPVLIENKPGAGTALGLVAVRNAAPDGYTILLGGTSGIVNQALDKSVAYHIIKDFAPIAIIGEVPYALVVNPQVQAKTFGEFVGLLKSQPGKLNYASGGMGSSNHFATELLLSMTGATATHIPYNSSATAIASIMSGDTQFGFDTPVTAKPQVAAGKLRVLATSTGTRSRSMPEVPTIAESGVPGYEVTGFFAIVAPAKTPADVVARLNREIVAIMEDNEMRNRLLPTGFEVKTSKSDAAEKRFSLELERWSKLAQDLKLQK